MQLIAEHRGCGAHFLLVFILDRGAGKAKEHRPGEGCLDCQQHIAKGRPMALINNEHNPLATHDRQISGLQSVMLFADVAHLLDRGHNQRIRRIIALELANEDMGILCFLHRVALLLLCQSCTGKVAVLLQGLGAQLNSVHEENHLIRITGGGDQLGRLEGCHGFAGAGCVPDIAPQLFSGFPVGTAHLVGNGIGSVVLITAHDLQHTVRIIGNGVEANQLVCHGNGQQRGSNALPVIDRLIIEVSPVEIVIRVEFSIRAGIGKVERFLRIHGHKNLNQRKQPGENSFSGVFLNLVCGLADGDAAFLQLDMNHRHPVDQQHQIPTPVIGQLVPGRKLRLLHNLITALPGGNLPTLIDLQGNFLAEVGCIIRIVPLDGDAAAVDEAVQAQRCAQGGDLLNDLLHLPIRQRKIIQAVNTPVVFKQNISPVPDQLRFAEILQDLIFPALCLQQVNQGLFKVRFFAKCHGRRSPCYANIFSSMDFLMACSFSSLR